MESKYHNYIKQLENANKESLIDDESYKYIVELLSKHENKIEKKHNSVTGSCYIAENESEYKFIDMIYNIAEIEINGDLLVSGNINSYSFNEFGTKNRIKINGDTKIDGNINLYETNECIADNTSQAAGERKKVLKINSGTAELIASGMIISFKGNHVEIETTIIDEPLRIVFFISEENEDDVPAKANILDKKTVELTLFKNKNSFNPSGTLRPFSIGTWGGRQLYIHYRVYDMQGGDSTICFNIYLQSEKL